MKRELRRETVREASKDRRRGSEIVRKDVKARRVVRITRHWGVTLAIAQGGFVFAKSLPPLLLCLFFFFLKLVQPKQLVPYLPMLTAFPPSCGPLVIPSSFLCCRFIFSFSQPSCAYTSPPSLVNFPSSNPLNTFSLVP